MPMSTARRLLLSGAAASLALHALPALASPEYAHQLADHAKHGPDPSQADFMLRDHLGRDRKLADYRGRVVALSFGYTQCPDVCPTTLSTLAGVMKQLGPAAAQVQVLFVTLDPERDTRRVLAKYVPGFDRRFVALYGDAAATAKAAKSFDLDVERKPGPTPTSYTIDHSAGTFLIDRHGRLRVYVEHGQPETVYLADLRALLAEQ